MYKNGWELVGIKTTGEITSYIMKRMNKMEKEMEIEEESTEAEESTGSNKDEKN